MTSDKNIFNLFEPQYNLFFDAASKDMNLAKEEAIRQLDNLKKTLPSDQVKIERGEARLTWILSNVEEYDYEYGYTLAIVRLRKNNSDRGAINLLAQSLCKLGNKEGVRRCIALYEKFMNKKILLKSYTFIDKLTSAVDLLINIDNNESKKSTIVDIINSYYKYICNDIYVVYEFTKQLVNRKISYCTALAVIKWLNILKLYSFADSLSGKCAIAKYCPPFPPQNLKLNKHCSSRLMRHFTKIVLHC